MSTAAAEEAAKPVKRKLSPEAPFERPAKLFKSIDKPELDTEPTKARGFSNDCWDTEF